MKQDVLLTEFKRGFDSPENVLDIPKHVNSLKEFYLNNANASTKDSVDSFVDNINVFDYIDFFLKGKRNKKAKELRVKKETQKENKELSEHFVKTFRVNDRRNPKMIILQDTTEKLVIKNPPFRKHNWSYMDLRSSLSCFLTSRIGDVIYRIYIDGQKSYYYMLNSPTSLDKLGLRNTYLRMFEYGRYRLSDVRLEIMDKCVYVKSKAVKYERI